jgi:hypothetical protein
MNMKRALVPLALFGLGFGVLPLSPAAPLGPAAASALEAPDWRVAVVFARSGKARNYVGTATVEALPAPAAPVAGAAPEAPHYEIWLAGDGALRGLWYSSVENLYGEVNGEHGFRDDGSLRRLLGRVAPLGPPPGQTGGPRVFACPTFGSPPSLAAQCRGSDLIVVGRVVGVLREAHSPIGAEMSRQHTVSLFAVEEYLKGPPSAPPVVKVHQNVGSLPWRMEGLSASGAGYEEMQNPRLLLGERYCLFLKRPADPSGRYAKIGYVSGSTGGISGKVAELDEFMLVDNRQGRLLLRNGRTKGQPRQPFDEEPQILNLPEHDAVALIRSYIATRTAGTE